MHKEDRTIVLIYNSTRIVARAKTLAAFDAPSYSETCKSTADYAVDFFKHLSLG